MTEEDIKTGTAEGEQPQAPEQTPEQAANDLTRPTNANMRWYIIHAYSGFERKVKESLESRVQAFGLQAKIGRVVIPMETVTQVRNGKKYNMEQLVYPGYVLVEMELSDEVWHVVKATPRVTGFLGGATHPTPLSAAYAVCSRARTPWRARKSSDSTAGPVTASASASSS